MSATTEVRTAPDVRTPERAARPAPWTRPRPTRRELRTDAVVAGCLAVVGVLTLELGRVQGATLGGEPPPALEQAAWLLAITLVLAARRRLPVTTLLVVAVLFVGLQARYVPEAIVSSVALYLAIFTAGAWGRHRRASAVARAVVVVGMFVWLTVGLFTTPYGELIPDATVAGSTVSPRTAYLLVSYAFNTVYFGAAVAFGELAWRAACQRALLEQRTAELEAEREQVAQRTREAERLVLARDLHDVVAHYVSLMGVQAGAARRAFDRQPERAREALGHVEQTSRRAVQEMHRMLEVLRGGTEDAPAAVTGIPALVEATRGAGLAPTLAVVGEERELPPSVSAAAYRIVQEALTNTVKHAAAASVHVQLRYLEGAVEVEVVDDGRARSAPAGAPAGAGRGQTGMRERVAMHDGSLELGPRPTGGYRVRARLPT